jgi:predicted O-linked N-acetylglucosamine transferase (SPINDLY family)
MFIEPVIERLPAHGFEVFCYYNHGSADEVTDRLRSKAAGWRDIHSIDDDAVAAHIRQDRIDLLVDLAGHTAGHRLRVFARRPAPVQLTMIGHVNTTGVDAIDYRITDAIAEPAEPAEPVGDGRDHDRWYTEKLIRLPHTCWCMRPFDPPGPVPDSRAPAGLPFTFGSFNNFAKVSERALDLWIALLRSLPATRLVMVTVPEGSTQARLRERFERGGVDPSRLDLHGLLPGQHYRSLHGAVDLALDPFPCNGATTTLDTLWLGVPVVALEGDSFRSRNGASILRNAGLDALVARSEDDYLAIARRLASDPAQLAPIRARLGERLRDTPLMDEAAFAGDLADALRAAWAGRPATASPR